MILSEDKWISDFEEKVLRGYFDDISPEDWFTVSITQEVINKTKQQCFECGTVYKEARCEAHPKATGCYRCHLMKEHFNGKEHQ